MNKSDLLHLMTAIIYSSDVHSLDGSVKAAFELYDKVKEVEEVRFVAEVE